MKSITNIPHPNGMYLETFDFRFAVFVFHTEDGNEMRAKMNSTVWDNVLSETGLLWGNLERAADRR